MPIRKHLPLAMFALALCLAPAVTLRAEWGTLTGRLVYNGQPVPVAAKIEVNKDREVCGKQEIFDERLVVAADGAIKDVVVWLRNEDVPVAPTYADGADSEVVLEFKDCCLEPHIVTMRNANALRDLKRSSGSQYWIYPGLREKEFRSASDHSPGP